MPCDGAAEGEERAELATMLASLFAEAAGGGAPHDWRPNRKRAGPTAKRRSRWVTWFTITAVTPFNASTCHELRGIDG